MIVKTNTDKFKLEMNNIVEYAFGFLDGAKKGKNVFMHNLGRETLNALAKYIDISARGNPSALQHVYEWYQVGSPNARLFDLNYTVSSLGLSINATFKQSRTIKNDSNVPFYNKAKIMETGIPVTIRPTKSPVLAFDEGGETIFTKKPVVVRNPGGDRARGSFEKTMDEFMLRYFKQSFLRASGIYNYIKKPTIFKRNIKSGARLGRARGIDTGFKWIANAKFGVE